MATYYARKSGNINATDVWATTPSGTAGAQTFAAGDVLVANSFTVTVNVSTDLGAAGEVRNDTTGGATAGGSFSLSAGVTLTANVFAGSAACVTTAGSVSATIVGNVNGSATANAAGVSHGSTGTVTVTGAVSGGAAGGGILVNSSGALTVTGNVVGGASNNSQGVTVPALGFSPVVTITGNVTGGTAGFAEGFRNQGTATVNITGNVSGGSGSACNGIVNNSTGTVAITGTCTGGSGASTGNSCGGAVNNSTGSITATRARGGSQNSHAPGVFNATAGGSVTVDEIEYGATGVSPTAGPVRFRSLTTNVCVVTLSTSGTKNLVDANASGLMPAASNVRSGVSYNGGNSVGTCAVPAASSVAFGVLVDNTTGTAALTPAAVWDYLTTSANTADSMGERLKNAATVASVGQALADALTP